MRVSRILPVGNRCALPMCFRGWMRAARAPRCHCCTGLLLRPWLGAAGSNRDRAALLRDRGDECSVRGPVGHRPYGDLRSHRPALRGGIFAHHASAALFRRRDHRRGMRARRRRDERLQNRADYRHGSSNALGWAGYRSTSRCCRRRCGHGRARSCIRDGCVWT